MMNHLSHSKIVLPIIVLAQFCCTSLWFAVNAVISELQVTFSLDISITGHLTSSVQFGFICGTLVFALLAIVDRFSPSKVFFICSVAGALFNIAIFWSGNTYLTLVLSRFAVGFCLAGIYPVGMKIAADYYQKGLGRSLGFLVGALVLGTALPHLIKGLGETMNWRYVVGLTSLLAMTGGMLLYLLVPDGPFRKMGSRFSFSHVRSLSQMKEFTVASIGYFGHMWELYAFWTFTPVIFTLFFGDEVSPTTIAFLSFATIALGSAGCVLGGYLSGMIGVKKMAFTFLTISTICCLLLPLVMFSESAVPIILLMFIWGFSVVADSPLFSTLVALNSPGTIRGSAITIVTCLGFLISILSIQFINAFTIGSAQVKIFLILAVGPLCSLLYTILARGKNSFDSYHT